MLKRVMTIALTGAVLLGVVIGSVSWIGMTPAERTAVGHSVTQAGLWVGMVGVLPWATWFLTTFAARRDSNTAGALLVGAYMAMDAALLAWMFSIPSLSTTGLSLAALGLLTCLAYNVLVCDWIAEKVGT